MKAIPALLIAALLQDLPGAKAEPRDERWLKRHEGFAADARRGGIGLLLLGDSLTDAWRGQKALWKERFEPLRAANFGMMGDCTQHLLWRLRNGALGGPPPRAIMLLIGTNNLGWGRQDPASTVAGVTAVVQEIRSRCPNAGILLLGVFPRADVPTEPQLVRIREVNAGISKLDDGRRIRFLDLGPSFLAEDGSVPKDLMPDGLHLSDRGYRIWADAVREPLAELLK